MYEVSENFISMGRVTFSKEVAIPAGQIIEDIAKDFPCSEEPPLRIDPRPEAFLTAMEGLVGIVVFFGGWAANKFLDEIYEAKFAPVIKPKLQTYMQLSPAGKKYSLAISAQKKGRECSVLVCCVGETIEEIEASERHISKVLELAEKEVDHDASAVYLFVIDNGYCDLRPRIHANYNDALSCLKHMYPAKLPTYVRTEC